MAQCYDQYRGLDDDELPDIMHCHRCSKRCPPAAKRPYKAASRAPALFGPDPDSAVVQVAEELMRDSVRLPPYQWACDSMADTDHRDDLPSIDAPTLVIYGEHDGVTPPSLSKQLAAGIPGAELVEIADAGHLANQERPDEFNSAVADFLGRRSPLGQGGTP